MGAHGVCAGGLESIRVSETPKHRPRFGENNHLGTSQPQRSEKVKAPNWVSDMSKGGTWQGLGSPSA